MFFFLVEERREAGQVSQPVRACKPGLEDLSKPTAPAYFWGVKLMYVGVMNYSQVQKIRFIVVKIFWSNSNQFLVISIRSSELASLKHQNKITQKDIQIIWKPCGVGCDLYWPLMTDKPFKQETIQRLQNAILVTHTHTPLCTQTPSPYLYYVIYEQTPTITHLSGPIEHHLGLLRTLSAFGCCPHPKDGHKTFSSILSHFLLFSNVLTQEVTKSEWKQCF